MLITIGALEIRAPELKLFILSLIGAFMLNIIIIDTRMKFVFCLVCFLVF